MRLNPNNADLHYTLRPALYVDETSPVSKAEREFRSAVALQPDRAGARLYLAHCLEDLQRWEEALHEFRKIDYARLLIEFEGKQK